jgi:hypothetical protein
MFGGDFQLVDNFELIPHAVDNSVGYVPGTDKLEWGRSVSSEEARRER